MAFIGVNIKDVIYFGDLDKSQVEHVVADLVACVVPDLVDVGQDDVVALSGQDLVEDALADLSRQWTPIAANYIQAFELFLCHQAVVFRVARDGQCCVLLLAK